MLKRALLGAFTIVLVLLGPASAQALEGPERESLRYVNEDRAQVLDPGARLSRYAEQHARRMARAGHIYHSDLSQLPKIAGWRKAGENVGVTTGSLEGLHAAFMDSPTHRRNVLDPCYEKVGVGAVKRDGRVWVVHVFLC